MEEASNPERGDAKVGYALTATTHQDSIQKLYLAFFLRPADPGGFNYYARKLADGGTDIPSIASGFASSPEYLQTYSGMSTAQRIDAIYRNLFDRPAETDALNYWGDRLESGALNIGNIAFSIMLGAQNGDLATINNRIVVSKQFTSRLDTQRELEAYTGPDAASTARELLRSVSSDTSTHPDALGPIDRVIKYLGASGQISRTAAGDNVALGSDTKADILIYSSDDRGRLDTVVGFQAKDRIDLSALNLANSIQTCSMRVLELSESLNFFAKHQVVIGRYGSDSYVYLDVDKDGSFSSSLDTVVRLVGVELQASALTV